MRLKEKKDTKEIKRQNIHYHFSLNGVATRYKDDSMDYVHYDTGIKIIIPSKTAIGNIDIINGAILEFIKRFNWENKPI